MLTKNDLQQIDNLIKSHIFPLQESFDEKLENMESKLTEFKSEILDAVDAVMGEIIKSREEQTVQSFKLSDHEERIGNLETKL